MGIFFGTDGLRGKVNDDLSSSVAYKCGNALGTIYSDSKVIIGTDTRKSASLILTAFACGAINAGLSVTSVGVCPTAGISYLTKTCGFDFGVVISASHNSAEYNGIKIFDKNGVKLGDKREEKIEKSFLKETALVSEKLGDFTVQEKLTKIYKNFLKSSINSRLDGLKVVLDCSNGATSSFAPQVFKQYGAKVISFSNSPNGSNINKNCGSLHTEKLQKRVKGQHADVGFAFDGDGDRVIAVDEKGNVIDGDKILYLLAMSLKSKGELNPAIVVGTRHTNMGVELALKSHGIELIKVDIGDKYVSAKLQEMSLVLGGEQSGHIINRNKLCTGDGILTALLVAQILKDNRKKLSEYFDFDIYSQCNVNVKVFDKMKVINSELLSNTIETLEKSMDGGRIMVRVSGTEPYIRIMAESRDEVLSAKIANEIKKVVKQIDEEFDKCAE